MLFVMGQTMLRVIYKIPHAIYEGANHVKSNLQDTSLLKLFTLVNVDDRFKTFQNIRIIFERHICKI